MGLLKTRNALLISFLGLTAINTTYADNFNADINDDAVKFQYNATNTSSNLDFSLAVLHHDEDGEIYNIGIQVEGRSLQQSNIFGSLGTKLYYIDLDGNADGAAIGLGGNLQVGIPNVEGLSIEAEAYYAPRVLAFNDIEHHLDFSAKIKYRVLENGSVYVGYRKANVDIEDASDGDLDDGFHIGIALDI